MQARNLSGKTPLLAAFFCSVLLLGGCRSPSDPGDLPAAACTSPTTPVAAVQGSGNASPSVGQALRVRGVVTWVDPLTGVFLEERASDADPATSNALFIDSPELAERVAQGEQLVVAGTVAELGEGPDTLTALTGIEAIRVCESGVPLPISESRLPLSGDDRESLEAMNVSFRQAMAVTDVYRLDRGQIRISANRILAAPTEVARPGEDARQQGAHNRSNTLYLNLAEDDEQAYSVGATVMAADGLMGHDGRYQQLWLRDALPFMPVTQYQNPEPQADEARIVSLNLHNYFNGDGRGGGFPTERGAKTPAEFNEQRARLRATIEFAQPQLIGVMELENDGFGSGSAAQDFLLDLRAATGSDWAAINPLGGPIGTDKITVGLFYRMDLFQPVGVAQVLASAPFQRLSRQPVAQVFRHLPSGQTLLIVVNHLKSKGSCPENGPNANKRDGQGCWSPARTEAARDMTSWASRLANDLAGGRALILGDMNAYRLEDPIQAIIEAGFRDLTASTGLRHEYTYVFAGEAGTLDYAFASGQLQPMVRSGRVLNINAGYPPGLPLELPWLRSSDHDPVVVDIRLRPVGASD